MWGVEELASHRLVGRVGFHCPEGWPEYELGWTIGREFWGRGFATEAASVVLEHAFTAMSREHIVSLIDPLNESSKRVAQRLGERIAGEIEIDGQRFVVYGISRSAWPVSVSPRIPH